MKKHNFNSYVTEKFEQRIIPHNYSLNLYLRHMLTPQIFLSRVAVCWHIKGMKRVALNTRFKIWLPLCLDVTRIILGGAISHLEWGADTFFLHRWHNSYPSVSTNLHFKTFPSLCHPFNIYPSWKFPPVDHQQRVNCVASGESICRLSGLRLLINHWNGCDMDRDSCVYGSIWSRADEGIVFN